MIKVAGQSNMQPLIPVLIGVAVFNAVLPPALLAIEQAGPVSALLSGFNQSGVVWLSLAVAVHLLLQKPSATDTPHQAQTSAVRSALPVWLICFSFLLIIPLASLAWIVAAALTIVWQRAFDLSVHQKAACILICAIALRGPVTLVCLTLFSSEILNFDTQAAALLLQLQGTTFSVTENVITNANGHSLLILTGCSVFTNLSLAMLLWLSLTLLYQNQIQRADTWRLAAVILVQLSLNTARLSMMATDISWYRLLHDGFGGTLFEWSTLLTALLFVKWRTSDESLPDRTVHPAARNGHCASHPPG